jgi:hypothetical protein
MPVCDWVEWEDPEPEVEPWAPICCLDEITRNGDPCFYDGFFTCVGICSLLPEPRVVGIPRVLP